MKIYGTSLTYPNCFLLAVPWCILDCFRKLKKCRAHIALLLIIITIDFEIFTILTLFELYACLEFLMISSPNFLLFDSIFFILLGCYIPNINFSLRIFRSYYTIFFFIVFQYSEIRWNIFHFDLFRNYEYY